MSAIQAIQTDAIDEFDWDGFRRYLAAAVESLEGELDIRRFTGGFSNLTYLVAIGAKEFVVKRPPTGPRPKGAHDMGREHRILAGLQEHYPYCPRAIAYCGDPKVAGAEFLVMERLDGTVVRPAEIDRLGITDAQLRLELIGLVDALAKLHEIDPAAVLPGFGKPKGYRERQLEGWISRLEAASTDELVDFSTIVAWLRANNPTGPSRAAVIHNDFKLDNLVWTGPQLTELKGVLDWEMATVGDPLMDLACTISFWIQEDDPEEFKALRAMPSAFPSAPTREQAMALYSAKTGEELNDTAFYLCFGLFRRAVIEQQKYARYRRGHSNDERYAGLNRAIPVIREMCLQAVGQAA